MVISACGGEPNCNPGVILIEIKGGAVGLLALNSKPLSKTTLSAVVAKKEPEIFKLALAPKLIPFGLIKIKFAAPSTPKVPKISEGLTPVTRVRILAIPAGLSKTTFCPLLTLNSRKLWNKLSPRIAPPSIKSCSI